MVLIQLVVNFEDGVFVFFARLAGVEQLAGDAVGIDLIRRGIERQDILHNGIQAHASGVVADARGGDVDGLADTALRVGVAEDAGFEGGGGHDGGVGQGSDEAIALIVEEKEGFVLDDGATDRATIEVADVGILGGDVTGERVNLVVEVIAGTERVPTAEIEKIAVKLVGATAGDDVDDGAVVAAVFRSEIIGEHAEFFGGVGIFGDQSAERARHVGIVVIGAVQEEIVVALASAVYGDAAQAV